MMGRRTSAVQGFGREAKTLAQGQFICPEHVKLVWRFPTGPLWACWERPQKSGMSTWPSWWSSTS